MPWRPEAQAAKPSRMTASSVIVVAVTAIHARWDADRAGVVVMAFLKG